MALNYKLLKFIMLAIAIIKAKKDSYFNSPKKEWSYVIFYFKLRKIKDNFFVKSNKIKKNIFPNLIKNNFNLSKKNYIL